MFLASSSDRRGVQGVRISTASFWNSAPLEIEGFAQVLRQAAVGLADHLTVGRSGLKPSGRLCAAKKLRTKQRKYQALQQGVDINSA